MGLVDSVNTSDKQTSQAVDHESHSPGIWNLLSSRKLPTLTYCAVFLSFGLCVAFLGPTILDLCCMTQTSTDKTFWMILAQTSAMLLGNLFTGAILSKLDCTNAVLLVGTLMQAVTIAIIPMARSLHSLTAILAVMGFHMGIVDTAGNVAMVRLYHKHVSSFIQAMHFCYGLGAVLSPMVAGPFLDDKSCNGVHDGGPTSVVTVPALLTTLTIEKSSMAQQSSLQYAFFIMALLQFPAIGLVVTLILYSRKASKDSNLNESTPIVKSGEEDVKSVPCFLSIPGMCFLEYPMMSCFALLSSALLIFTSDGLQASFASYVFAYGKFAIPELTKQHAANLDAAFWGAFTVGRLIAVFMSIWLQPKYLLCYDLLGCLFTVVALWILPVSQTLLLVCSSLVGLFLASVSPAVITFMEQRVGLTASATSFLVFVAALGEMTYPIMVGNLLSEVGPTGFTLSSLGSTIAALVFFTSLLAKLYVRDEIENNKGNK